MSIAAEQKKISEEKGSQQIDQYTRISTLLKSMSINMGKAMKEIQTINMQMRMLSFNSQIEAARAGEAGKAFSIVSGEMNSLAEKTSTVTESLETETDRSISELNEISQEMATNVRGMRLSDLALNNIDLIDRNLFERSCDVRWWATDSSLTEALTHQTSEALEYASKRLGIILNAYTVYYDLVLCDAQGRVVANGRPYDYSSQGMDQSREGWFVQAINSGSGDDYGFQTVHRSPLVNDKLVLIYSCSVRERGEAHGKILGALGILFNYEALAQTIMHEVALSPQEKERSRVCIIDDQGTVLADSQDQILLETIDFPKKDQLFAMKKGFILTKYNNKECCVGYAHAPGYETYTTGWHSLIIQNLT